MFFTAIKSKPPKSQSIDFNETQPTQQSSTSENVTYDLLRQKVRELAYQKWEQAGCPWGQDKEFWVEAETELFGENPLQFGGYKIKSGDSYILICPIISEVPVEVEIDSEFCR